MSTAAHRSSTTLAALIVASLVGGAVVASGCNLASIRVIGVAKKTQLENQLLGTFARLSRDLILVSAVRSGKGRDKSTAARVSKLSSLERDAIEAMLRREFNRDDVEALKDTGVVGEGNDGMLKLLLPPKDAAKRARVQRLVQQENADRMVVLRRAIDISPDLEQKDLPLARRVFYRLNLQASRKNHQIQQLDGKWIMLQKGGQTR